MLKAVLFVIVGSVIVLLGGFVVIGYATQIESTASPAILILALLLLSVGAIIDIIGALWVFDGFKMMKPVCRIYSIGQYGALAQLTAGVLMAAGFYIIIFSNRAAAYLLGSGFALVGYAIGAACALPVGIAFYQLGKRYNVLTVKVGASMYVVIPVIGPLVLYLGLKKIADR